MEHLIYHNGKYYIGDTADYIRSCSARSDKDLSLREATSEEKDVHIRLGREYQKRRKLEREKEPIV